MTDPQIPDAKQSEREMNRDPITGTLGAHPVGAGLDASEEDLYWQRAFITEPYYKSELVYDDYAPAYRVGYLHRQHKAEHPTWEQAETDLQSEWERNRGTSRLSWEEARDPIRAAWHRADGTLDNTDDPYFGVN